MRFKDTKRFSPVIYENDIPHDRDLYWISPEAIPTKVRDLEKFMKKFIIDRTWWDRQRTRCVHGYIVRDAVDFEGGDVLVDGLNVIVNADGTRYIPHLDYTINADGDIWIPGRMYTYLNFWKISREDRMTQMKTLGNPYFTDLSFENWLIRERMRKEFKDNGWFKCRQKGLSEEEACDTGWCFLFLNDIQVAIVGGEDIYNDNTFKMVKRGVYQLYNTQFYKEIAIDNSDMFKTLNTGVEIHSRTAKNNAQILSGLNSLYKAHLEEIGIMRAGLSREIASFVKPSIRTLGGRRTGYITYTGTSGKYEDGVEDIEKMLYDPNAYDLLTFKNIYSKDVDPESITANFIPAWKFKVIDDDGNSLKAESLKLIEEERKQLKSSEKAIKIASEPNTPEEMFSITAGGFFGEVISHQCSEARSLIITHKKLQRLERGFLHFKDRRKPWEGVEWEIDEDKGDVVIAEHPCRDGEGKVIDDLYEQGTDSYDFSEAMTSSSKLASLVYKKYNKDVRLEENTIFNNFVALYLDRPTLEQGGRETAYENAAKLSIYYHTLNLIEYTKIAIFDYYEKWGLEGYLKLRPDFVIAQMVERTDVSNKYGFPGSLVPHALIKFKDWLTPDNIFNCPFDELLKLWAKFKIAKNYNCDITIASSLCVISVEDQLLSNMGSSTDRKVNERTFKGYKQMNGMLMPVYK